MAKLAEYIDAERTVRALRTAIETDGSTPQREQAILQARAAARVAYGRLNGGEISRARRQLAGES